MVLAKESQGMSAVHPAEGAAPQGQVRTLLSSALRLREVPRDAIGDTFDGAPSLVGALIGLSAACSLPYLCLYVMAEGNTAGFLAGMVVVKAIISLLVCVVGGGILSYLNSRIAGCKHGWREYKIFMSGVLWTCLMDVAILASMGTGAGVLSLLGLLCSCAAAGYYTSMNYRFKLGHKGAWRVIHQIYATLALGAMILYA